MTGTGEFDDAAFAVQLRRIAEPIASDFGLDYNQEVIDGPSSSVQGAAFVAVSMAGHLYLEMNEADSFPSGHRRTARSGSRYVGESAGSDEAGRAVLFLAHVLPQYMRMESDFRWILIDRETGEPRNNAADFLGQSLEAVSPIDDAGRGLVDELLEPFHEAQGRGAEDSAMLSADWRAAIAEGRNPRHEGPLVTSQFMFSKRWFVSLARELALEFALEDFLRSHEAQMDSFSDHLVREAASHNDLLELHWEMRRREMSAVVYWDGIAAETYRKLMPFAATSFG